MQATLCPPALAADRLALRFVGGGRRQCRQRPDGQLTITGPDRHRLGSGGELRDGERRGSAGEPGGVGPPVGRCGDPRICSRSIAWRSTSPHKTLPIAQQRGSNLLSQIVTTLQDGHDFPGAPNIAEPVRLALLIGHDSQRRPYRAAAESRLADSRPPGQRGIARQRARLRAVPRGPRQAGAMCGWPISPRRPNRCARRPFSTLPSRPGVAVVDLPACAAYAYEQVVPAGALRRDRQGCDRSRLRDDQALGLRSALRDRPLGEAGVDAGLVGNVALQRAGRAHGGVQAVVAFAADHRIGPHRPSAR